MLIVVVLECVWPVMSCDVLCLCLVLREVRCEMWPVAVISMRHQAPVSSHGSTWGPADQTILSRLPGSQPEYQLINPANISYQTPPVSPHIPILLPAGSWWFLVVSGVIAELQLWPEAGGGEGRLRQCLAGCWLACVQSVSAGQSPQQPTLVQHRHQSDQGSNQSVSYYYF